MGNFRISRALFGRVLDKKNVTSGTKIFEKKWFYSSAEKPLVRMKFSHPGKSPLPAVAHFLWGPTFTLAQRKMKKRA